MNHYLNREVNILDLSKFFKKAPLVPIICQDERSGEVLMLGYANEEALQLTMDTGTAWFSALAPEAVEQGRDLGQFYLCQQDSVRLRR